jgi:hypothetical protein
MMEENYFYFCFLGYGDEKHKSYKNLVSILIHGGLIFNIQFYKGNKDEKKNGTKKGKMKAYEELKPWCLLLGFNVFTH